jgi:arylsulfatase A-like enzyme
MKTTSSSLSLAVLSAAMFAVSCGSQEQAPRSGVIITLDTTRAGALDLYGADRGITPNLTRLAQPGVVYDSAHTVAPITLPAHVSMMTGLYPLRHGVRDNGWASLSPEARTLAECAKERGFETAAFVSAVVLSAAYGLDQGFDLYSEPVPPNGAPVAALTRRSSREVTDDALAWLEQRNPDQPFLLWVHYFDPHFPYAPPPEFLEQAGGKPYLAEVASMDHDVGRLVDQLDEVLGTDAYLLAIVADHGESFGRHGEPTHTAYAYEATIHVPFLMRFPDGRGAGTRSDELVSVVDVFPTFMDVLGLGSVGNVDGANLAGDPIGSGRGVYMESYSGYLNYGWSPLAGWLDERGKYLHSTRPEYYDLSADPGELQDLIPAGQVDLGPYREALATLSGLPRLQSGALTLEDEQLEQLRALGYAAAGEDVRDLPDPLAPSTRPAPRDHAEHYARFCVAVGLAQGGRNAAAIPLLREVIAANPCNMLATETLGGCLLDEGQHDQIIDLFAPIVAAGRLNRFASFTYLGSAYEARGETREALNAYRAALALRPGETSVVVIIEGLIAALAEQGK